jgi:hypothetical protein
VTICRLRVGVFRNGDRSLARSTIALFIYSSPCAYDLPRADRLAFEHVIAALVHGSGYERISTPACSDRTIRRRLQEWTELGLAEQVHRLALRTRRRWSIVLPTSGTGRGGALATGASARISSTSTAVLPFTTSTPCSVCPRLRPPDYVTGVLDCGRLRGPGQVERFPDREPAASLRGAGDIVSRERCSRPGVSSE